jgi:hypothetical protein
MAALAAQVLLSSSSVHGPISMLIHDSHWKMGETI